MWHLHVHVTGKVYIHGGMRAQEAHLSVCSSNEKESNVKLPVVHHEHLKFLGVVDDELVKSVGEKVAGGLVGSVTNGRLGDSSLEASSHSGVNTLGLSPGVTELLKSLVMMTLKRLCALLDNLCLNNRSYLGHDGGM
mgnify:CR=1